jgi:hypothetical protein
MSTVDHVAKLAKECADRRRKHKVVVTEWVRSKDNGKRVVRAGSAGADASAKNKLISTEPVGLVPAYRLTLLSKRQRPRFDEHPSAVGALRDLAWIQIVEDFRVELKKKKLRLDDLKDYAARHPLIHSVGPWKHEHWTFRKASTLPKRRFEMLDYWQCPRR